MWGKGFKDWVIILYLLPLRNFYRLPPMAFVLFNIGCWISVLGFSIFVLPINQWFKWILRCIQINFKPSILETFFHEPNTKLLRVHFSLKKYYENILSNKKFHKKIKLIDDKSLHTYPWFVSVRQRSCGKVMFSQVSVSYSVHMGVAMPGSRFLSGQGWVRLVPGPFQWGGDVYVRYTPIRRYASRKKLHPL